MPADGRPLIDAPLWRTADRVATDQHPSIVHQADQRLPELAVRDLGADARRDVADAGMGVPHEILDDEGLQPMRLDAR